jgi:hypothetical protein
MGQVHHLGQVDRIPWCMQDSNCREKFLNRHSYSPGACFRVGRGLRVIRLWVLALVLLLLAPLRPAGAEDSPAPEEYQVKAAFLCNFARFVHWPESALPDSLPLSIGVLGDDPFGPALEEAVAGQVVDAHPFRILRSRRLAELSGCHILFLSPVGAPRPEEILAELAASPVLTIDDGGGAAVHGAVITFVIDENKVRFRINAEAANRAGLKLSARLLALGIDQRD